MAIDERGVTPQTARIEDLARENAELREQVRRFAAAQTVARGAMQQAAQEKDAAARIAHQVVVEEQATRAAVAVQSGNLGFALTMQIINFFVLVVLLFGLFLWLPKEVQGQSRPVPTTTITVPGAGTTVVPGR